MDAAQVEELMLNAVHHDSRWDDYPLDSWDAWEEMGGQDPVPVPGLGMVSIAESFGGEGQGDQYYLVFKVDLYDDRDEVGRAGSRYFRVDGYWQSFSGGDYDGPFYEVKPVQQMITVYEEVK